MYGPSTHLAADKWTSKDSLGFEVYAHAIARFLTHYQTQPPLCISIQAPWGGGKTSLMRMIQRELDKDSELFLDGDPLVDLQYQKNVKDILNILEKIRKRKEPDTKVKIQVGCSTLVYVIHLHNIAT
jgi:predicted AAA+ superfamily ATPase